MALLVRPPNWQFCSHNQPSAPTTSPSGTVIASTTGSDTKGTAVSCIAALTHDVELLVVCISDSAVSGSTTSGLFDILVDPAGGTSWNTTSPLIPNLLGGWRSTLNTGAQQSQSSSYAFPVWVPAGASIGARWACASATARNATVAVYAYGGNQNPGSWWCGQKVTTIGVNTTGSKGTNHTPGNSSAYSSWTDFGSTLPQDAKAFVFAVGGSDATMNSAAYYFEFGIASKRIGAPVSVVSFTTEALSSFNAGIYYSSAPAGTQLQVRATCSTTAEVYDVAAYAIS